MGVCPRFDGVCERTPSPMGKRAENRTLARQHNLLTDTRLWRASAWLTPMGRL